MESRVELALDKNPLTLKTLGTGGALRVKLIVNAGWVAAAVSPGCEENASTPVDVPSPREGPTPVEAAATVLFSEAVLATGVDLLRVGFGPEASIVGLAASGDV